MLASAKRLSVKHAEHLEEKSWERLKHEQQIQKYFFQTNIVCLEQNIKALKM